MKHVEVDLPYFKKGDDMCHCLEQSKNDIVEAARMHASMLEAGAKHLRTLAERLADSGQVDQCKMDADTHMISLNGPDDLIDKLLAEELVSKDPFEDEEDDCDEDFEEDEAVNQERATPLPNREMAASLPPSYTPCTLDVEFVMDDHLDGEGKGLASFSREYMWPGTPVLGTDVDQHEIPWPAAPRMKVASMSVTIDDAADPVLHVVLEAMPLEQHFRLNSDPGKWLALTRANFLGAVRDMLEAGWQLDFPASWFPRQGPPPREEISDSDL